MILNSFPLAETEVISSAAVPTNPIIIIEQTVGGGCRVRWHSKNHDRTQDWCAGGFCFYRKSKLRFVQSLHWTRVGGFLCNLSWLLPHQRTGNQIGRVWRNKSKRFPPSVIAFLAGRALTVTTRHPLFSHIIPSCAHTRRLGHTRSR